MTASGVVGKFLELHPNVVLLLILITGGTGGVVLNPFVLSQEYQQDQTDNARRLSSVEYELCQFRNQQARANADATIRQLNALIWDLQRAVDTEGLAAEMRDIRMLNDARSDKETAEALRGRLLRVTCKYNNE